jgi:hypothetical protein
MGGDFSGFKTAAAIYAHINDHAARSHIADHFLCNNNRCTATLCAQGPYGYFAGL